MEKVYEYVMEIYHYDSKDESIGHVKEMSDKGFKVVEEYASLDVYTVKFEKKS